jgi:hypothetical protein
LRRDYGAGRRDRLAGSWRGLAILFPLVLLLIGSSAGAAEQAWRIAATAGDIVARRCAIEIDLKPLSVFGEVLSLAVIYRQLPGKCDQPLRNYGYVGVHAIRLSDGKRAILTDYVEAPALFAALRRAPQIQLLLGKGRPASLGTLLGECDRRLSPASLSQFFVDRAGALRLGWSNECGSLGDEPQIEGFTLASAVGELAPGIAAQPLELSAMHLRFEAKR